MLNQLSIQNYALIDALEVHFNQGFTTITGETGAGKSILLGGLSLVLGKRADLSALKKNSRKCVIEAQFGIAGYGLQPFFKVNDLDYEPQTILRREILPSGKSRAFINDTPVTLQILSSLGSRLVDVHSQHQTMQLTENEFQFRVLDALADNGKLLQDYTIHLQEFKKVEKSLNSLLDKKADTLKELDYNTFLLEELEKVTLRSGMLEALEEEQEQLSNVEDIMLLLSQSDQLLNEEQIGLLASLNGLQQAFQRLKGFGQSYASLNERIQAVRIELDDIRGELDTLKDWVEADPQRLEEVNGVLQQLNDLFKKHQTDSVEGLMAIKETLSDKVAISITIDSDIEAHEQQQEKIKLQLEKLATEIRSRRKAVIPELKKSLHERMSSLGMAAAQFKVEIQEASDFKPNGKDNLSFLFSANKGSSFGALKKVASGGELSRIMLTIKSILAKYEQLPTLMFDEIDTGVSGEISNKMGDIMQEMGESMQVFSITHLPQVAAKGASQYKVFKTVEGNTTATGMRLLTKEERVQELAEMLGGKNLTDSALAHAKQLLG